MNHEFGDGKDPIALFQSWLEEAEASEPADANAMALATVDADGMPDVRMVLLKGCDQRGFAFYTNLDSAKGWQIRAHPKVALCFHWKSLGRQVRVRGPVEEVDAAEADAYFLSRARGSQIGAWASLQSRPLASRDVLEAAVARETARFGEGPIARPPHWSGFLVRPVTIEFWVNRPYRLHDRITFAAADDGWVTERLYP
jgi:pyridoxamine 5'-phosphate oxidase